MKGYKSVQGFISKEEILKYVKQEEIFQMVIGYYPKELVYVTSPFRKDKNPRCYFEWYNGTLYFKDWGYTKKHKDCFNAVQAVLKLSFYDALRQIAYHFDLANTKKPREPLPNKYLETTELKTQEINSTMEFMVRTFNNTSDKKFWQPYGITQNNLIEDNVFPILWYKLYSKKLNNKILIRPITRTYLIYNENNKVKFYTPDNTGKGKWITNCSANEIGGLSSLKAYGQQLIITKSYKDYRVLKNLKLDVIWFQNEGMFPDEEILLALISRFDKIVIFFDNDPTGINTAISLVEILNRLSPNKARNINLPISLLKENIKDSSDLYKEKGKQELINFLEINQILSKTPF